MSILAELDAQLRRMPPVERAEHLRALLGDLLDPPEAEPQPWPGRVRLRQTQCRIVRRLMRGPASWTNIAAAIYAYRTDWTDYNGVTVRVHLSQLRHKLRGAGIGTISRGTRSLSVFRLEIAPGVPAPWSGARA